MLQESILSGKPTRHMFEFSFLNCKVKYMLFWILSPNICLVFSTHLLCSNWSTSKSWFLLMLCRLSAKCRLVFLKCHQEDGIASLWKTMELPPSRDCEKLREAKQKREVCPCRGPTVWPWTRPFPSGTGFPICGTNRWAFEELNKMGEGQSSNDIQNMPWLQTCLIPSIIAIVAQPSPFVCEDTSLITDLFFIHVLNAVYGLPWWVSRLKTSLQCGRHRRCGFNPRVGKILWRRKNGNLLSIVAWRIPWMEEPCGLWYKGSQRVRHNWATKHTLQSMLHPAARLLLLKWETGNFPGGPVVKNLPCNSGGASSIPDPGTQIPHTEE